MDEQIRTRDQIPQEDKWAIEDLYVNDEAWEAEFATLEEEKTRYMAFAGTLGSSGKALYDYLRHSEAFSLKVDRLAGYCMRKNDEDTRNPSYQAMRGRFLSAMSAISTATSFAVPEIMAISDEDLDRFYAEDPELERYRRYLTDMRRLKDHVLSHPEEKLLASAGEICGVAHHAYSMFVDADLKFADAVDGEGKPYPVTQGTFITCMESPDRVLRKNAYESLYDGYGGFRNTLACLLDGENKTRKFHAQAKKFDSAFDLSLAGNNVPTSVYLNLIDTVHRNLGKMHRYVKLRKKIMGVDTLHFYDLYTPLVADADQKIPFAQAKQTVYESLAPLGEEYRGILREGFDNRWIDVYQNVGKRSGAYSADTWVHPFVLLNYTGTLDSQFTLTHEMGHAIHSYLSNKTQNPVDSGYVIFVAEVASTCNEALLMEYLLAKTQSKKERAYLINHYLDQFRGTIYRQTMFAEFELNIGRMVQEGQTLTAEVLCAEYRRLNELYYGPDIVTDDRIALEWARIPHFYYNYYVYQYATGYSAAIALSRRILEEGAPAVKDYLEFLSGGCTKSPIDLLRGAGVDMTAPEPVEQALSLFDRLLDEMESLMEEL